MVEVTTVRALEVVLARVRMSNGAAQELLGALDSHRRGQVDPAPPDLHPDAYRATLRLMLEDTRAGENWPRAALLTRLSLVREALRGLLNTTGKE